jgi:hypothetical protein
MYRSEITLPTVGQRQRQSRCLAYCPVSSSQSRACRTPGGWQCLGFPRDDATGQTAPRRTSKHYAAAGGDPDVRRGLQMPGRPSQRQQQAHAGTRPSPVRAALAGARVGARRASAAARPARRALSVSQRDRCRAGHGTGRRAPRPDRGAGAGGLAHRHSAQGGGSLDAAIRGRLGCWLAGWPCLPLHSPEVGRYRCWEARPGQATRRSTHRRPCAALTRSLPCPAAAGAGGADRRGEARARVRTYVGT